MNWIAWFAAFLLAAHLAAEWILAALNRSEARRRADPPPAGVAAVMDRPTRERSTAYTLARSRFGAWEEAWGALILAAALFSGILSRLFAAIHALGAPGVSWTSALFVVAALALLALPSLPLDAWEKFRVEAKFGFNHSTPGLWWADKAKEAAVALGLGFPLLWALFALVRWAGPEWWVEGFFLVLACQIALMILYPKLILPLFNRLSPLADGDLRTRLRALAERTGFRTAAIEVIDGSKRSGHSNAFFTGFGRFRRIVLYDTLIARLEPVELEAVLAHEIGHYRRGHIPRLLALSSAMLLAGFWVVAHLIRAPRFGAAFGFPPAEPAPAALLCLLLGGLVTYWLTPLFNLLSRRHEYQADAFAAAAMGGPEALIASLRKLARDNLSNLTPHPWFSAFHYSHPTLVEREAALERVGGRALAD